MECMASAGSQPPLTLLSGCVPCTCSGGRLSFTDLRRYWQTERIRSPDEAPAPEMQIRHGRSASLHPVRPIELKQGITLARYHSKSMNFSASIRFTTLLVGSTVTLSPKELIRKEPPIPVSFHVRTIAQAPLIRRADSSSSTTRTESRRSLDLHSNMSGSTRYLICPPSSILQPPAVRESTTSANDRRPSNMNCMSTNLLTMSPLSIIAGRGVVHHTRHASHVSQHSSPRASPGYHLGTTL